MEQKENKVWVKGGGGIEVSVDRSKVCFGEPEGFSWNPLKQWPRNMACFCGSKKKFKKCCIGKVKELVDKEDAEELRDLMKEFAEKQKELDKLKNSTAQ